jgi:hypothetical protein
LTPARVEVRCLVEVLPLLRIDDLQSDNSHSDAIRRRTLSVLAVVDEGLLSDRRTERDRIDDLLDGQVDLRSGRHPQTRCSKGY